MTELDRRRALALNEQMRQCCAGSQLDPFTLIRVVLVMSHDSRMITRAALALCEQWAADLALALDEMRALAVIMAFCEPHELAA
jgi:hypothetical protein